MATQTRAQQGQGNDHGMQQSRSSKEGQDLMMPLDDMINSARKFVREQPETAALWCLGIGFVLGWKLKPW